MPGKATTLSSTAVLLAIVLLASCARPNSTAKQEPGSSTGSASDATSAQVSQPSPPATSSPDASGCYHDGTPITAQAGDQPAPICLHPGETLTITTQSSPAQPWLPMTTSDAAVVVCTSRPLANGALTATCHALQPGTATVSTTTAAFTGDPHGPPQYTWSLTIHVEAVR